jgi:hypothetical protein
LAFVDQAIQVITLLNLKHGFVPKITDKGHADVQDMVEQLKAEGDTA